MTQHLLNTPWSLRFDRDGPEHFGVILDREGREIVSSQHFWLPQSKEDETPVIVHQLRLMNAAPKLFNGVRALIEAIGRLPVIIHTGQLTEALQIAEAAVEELVEGGVGRVV